MNRMGTSGIAPVQTRGRPGQPRSTFTHFVGPDGGVTLVALAAGKPGFAWHSIRSGNPDIWFGSPGD